MAKEEKYGPQGIWKGKEQEVNDDDEEEEEEEYEMDENEEEEEEEDGNQDLFEDLEDYGYDSNEMDGDKEGNSDDEEEEEKKNKKNKKKDKDQKSSSVSQYGEFRRKKGVVGLVFHDDLKQRRNPASSSQNSMGSSSQLSQASSKQGSNASSKNNNNKKPDKKQEDGNTDYDEVALRQYELSKLRYYFAIAECDTVETANILYEQLDDVELGDTAMAIELRFVPDDLDLSTREVRDACAVIPHNYKPPQFVVNALNHTKVECTWDAGEKERDRKLSNISSWRSLKESEFMQYIASSDSEDYEEPEDLEEEELASLPKNEDGSIAGSIKSLKKKKKAKNLRALLLGDSIGAADDDNESDDDGNAKKKRKSTKDDFFMETGGNSEDNFPEPDENGEITMTYVPEIGKELLDKKKEKESELSPLEIQLRKEAEKKKLRKAARKEFINQKEEEKEELLQNAKEQIKQKKKKALLAPENEEEYNEEDRLVTTLKPWELERKQQKEKAQKKLKKQKQSKGLPEDQDLPLAVAGDVDVTDERFKRVFEGDANFGIERTAAEFKTTKGMQKILDEQKVRREKKEKKQKQNSDLGEVTQNSSNKDELQSLANKLKRKFSAMK